MTGEFAIRKGNIDEAFALAAKLPEFQPWTPKADTESRLQNHHIVLIAVAAVPCGFKVGYHNPADGTFYSWIGGVLPAYRNQGIAGALLNEMEQFAKAQGYKALTMKTRNRHQAMLIFALKSGFYIIGVKPYPNPMETRILLRKDFH